MTARVTMAVSASVPDTPEPGYSRIYINNAGTVSSVSDSGTVTTYGVGITQEQVEDYVGNLIQSSSSVQAIYNDAGNVLTLTVLAGGVDHNSLLNYVANQHIDHSAVSISAGTGLTGGGTIVANRTINLANTTVTAGTYGSSSQSPTIAIDAQGRITSASNTTITATAIGAQPLDGDLTAVAALAGTGLVTRTATDTMTTRTVTAGTGISVTNGDGISGNPTVALTNVGTAGTYQAVTTDAQGRVTSGTNPTTLAGFGITDAQPLDGDLTAVANLATTGLISRTAANTMATRTITAGTGMTITNGDGVSGNPTVGITAVGTAGTYGTVNNFPVVTTNASGQVSSVTTNNVTSALLTGFSTASDADVLATDTVLAAFGKIQAIMNHWTELLNVTTLTNNSNTTTTQIADLNIPVVSGRRYRLEVYVRFASAAAGTGIALTFNTPDGATGTIAGVASIPIAGDGTASIYSGNITSLGDLVVATAVPAANTDHLATMQAIFTCTGSGTISPYFRSEVNGSTVTVQIGSNILSRDFA